MTKKFIIFVDEEFTAQERDKITNHFKNKVGYWHWIGNVWLLTTKKETYTTTSIRDELMNLTKRGMIVVLDASHASGWSAFGQKKKFEWLHTNWSKKPESFPDKSESELF